MQRCDLIAQIISDCEAAHRRFANSGLQSVAVAAAAISKALTGGHKLLAFGNGGSATDAQHLAAELVGRFERERLALAAIALTADTGVITAVANDYGYDRVFVRQIEALGVAGDVAFGISTSGCSPNVTRALVAGRSRGMLTIALTGRDGGEIGANADIHINVAESSTARVQEVHRTIVHAICSVVEGDLTPV